VDNVCWIRAHPARLIKPHDRLLVLGPQISVPSQIIQAVAMAHETERVGVRVLKCFTKRNFCTLLVLAFNGPVREGDALAQGILAALHLVTGRPPGESLRDELRDRLAAVAQSSGGIFGVPELQGVIASFATENLTIVSSVLCWRLLRAIDAVDADPTRVSEEIAELRRLAPELWTEYSSIRTRLRPPLSQASAIENEVKCGSARCQMILSGATTQKLAAPLPAFAQCDFCHRILIPVNVGDGISEQIVRGLESMSEVIHA
jgi:hypothetical protein